MLSRVKAMSHKRHELDSEEEEGALDSSNEDGRYPGYPEVHSDDFYHQQISSSRGVLIENFIPIPLGKLSFFGGQISGFGCRHCSLELTDRISLSCHITQVHRLPCCCAYCDHHFRTTEELVDHLWRVHRSNENLYCKLCPFVTNTQCEFWKHTWSRHKSQTKRCNQCQLTCIGKKTFWAHQDLCATMSLTPFQDVKDGQADTICLSSNSVIINMNNQKRPITITNCGSYTSGSGKLQINRNGNESLRSTWERTSGCSRQTEFNQSLRNPRIQKQILKSTETVFTKQVFSIQRSETRTGKRKPENRMMEGSVKKRKVGPTQFEGTRNDRNKTLSLKVEQDGVKAEPEAASHETRKENLLPKIAPKKEEDTTLPIKKRPFLWVPNLEMDVADVLGISNGEKKDVVERNPGSSFVPPSAPASVVTRQPKLPIKQRIKQEMACGSLGQLEINEESAGESQSGSHYRCSLCDFSTACIQSIKKHLATIHKVGNSTLQLFSVVQNTDKCQKNLKTFTESKKPATMDNSKDITTVEQDYSPAGILAQVRKEIQDLKDRISSRKHQ